MRDKIQIIAHFKSLKGGRLIEGLTLIRILCVGLALVIGADYSRGAVNLSITIFIELNITDVSFGDVYSKIVILKCRIVESQIDTVTNEFEMQFSL